MPTFGMLRSVALVRTDVLAELIVSIIRVKRISQLKKTLAETNNQQRRFLQVTHSVTFQHMAFFILTQLQHYM
jgi:hypothetical protein